MKVYRSWKTAVILPLSPVLLAIPDATLPIELDQRWEILNPEGVIKIEPMEINLHPTTLEGKTVLLRWNGKHNVDNFLDRDDQFRLFRESLAGLCSCCSDAQRGECL